MENFDVAVIVQARGNATFGVDLRMEVATSLTFLKNSGELVVESK